VTATVELLLHYTDRQTDGRRTDCSVASNIVVTFVTPPLTRLLVAMHHSVPYISVLLSSTKHEIILTCHQRQMLLLGIGYRAIETFAIFPLKIGSTLGLSRSYLDF